VKCRTGLLCKSGSCGAEGCGCGCGGAAPAAAPSATPPAAPAAAPKLPEAPKAKATTSDESA
jgi:hypothetical protein